MRLSLFGPESLVFASLFLTFLKSSSLCRSIKTGKNEPGQYPAIFDLTLGQWRTWTSPVKTRYSSLSLGVLGRLSLERLSITFTCGLLLIISTHKLVVSRNFLSTRIVLSFLLPSHFLFCEIVNLNQTFAVFRMRLLNLPIRAYCRLRRKQVSLSCFLTFFETRKLRSPFFGIIFARTD